MKLRPPENLLPLLGFYPSGDLGAYTIYPTRKRKVVWFLSTSPRKPASYLQRHHRHRWGLVNRLWNMLSGDTRAAWASAASKAHLTISGINLFLFYHMTGDAAAIRTVERHSGITLL